jgi:HAE1 family hydrophobic/amphiphilic exporter-1
VTISFNLKPGVSLGEAVQQIQNWLPPEASGNDLHQLSGCGAGLQSSTKGLWLLLGVAILVIYIVREFCMRASYIR